MIGYLVDGALDGIHGWDHFFRRELKHLIPNLRELIDRPADDDIDIFSLHHFAEIGVSG